MAAIEFHRICKSFGDHEVVVDMDLSIRNDEFVVFLGPSGCGKTTCLRMLAGLEEPSAGRILLDDVDVTDRSPRDRDIAMVFQSYALYPHMSVRENMSTGLRYRGAARAEIAQRVEQAARLLDLEALLDRRPAQLSGGQRQRVALGRAIVRRPKAFLMDEPLSNLDAALRARMRVELKLLHQRMATTTVYVTHDQVEAMTMADRIAVMCDGRLMQFDTPVRIFNAPANRFVASFVGAPTINLVPGTVRQTADGLWLDCLGETLQIGPEVAQAFRPAMPDGAVQIGIRPHSIAVAEAADGLRLDGRVVVVEPIGAEAHLHVRVADSDLVVVVEAATLAAPGDIVQLRIGRESILVFDTSDGRTLMRGV